MIGDRVARKVTWLRESTNGRIFAAAAMIAGFSSLVKLTNLGKEILVARSFGAGDALDAFYVAFLLPGFFIGILIASCNEAFIPTYVEIRDNEGIEAAQHVFSSIAVIYVAALVALSVALAISQRWLLSILASGFGQSKLALVRMLLFILLASLSLSGLSALWRAILNAHECFALTATAPIFIPVTIAILLLFSRPAWRIYALALGSVLGVTGEMAVNGYGLWRRGIPLLPRWYGFDWRLRQVLAQAVPAAAGAVLMGSTTLVDQAMAAMLTSGSVSALNYANKLVPLLLGIGTSSLSIAVLPAFSRLSANRDWQGMRHILSFYTRVILLVTLPVVAILIAFSEPLITLFFQRGAFTQENAHLVARVQSLLSLEVPFYAISILYVNAICALKRNYILMWGTTIIVPENIVLNYVFMKMFGLPGIALSTSVVLMTSCYYLHSMFRRSLQQQEASFAQRTCAIAFTVSDQLASR